MIKRILLLSLLFCTVVSSLQTTSPQQALNQSSQTFFISNQGKWNPEVNYLARIEVMNACSTNSGAVYDFFRIKKNFDEYQTLIMDLQHRRDFEN